MIRKPSKLAIFITVAFGFSWLLALVAWLVGVRTGNNVPTTVVGVVYMFGPALGAVAAQRWHGEGLKGPLEIRLRPNCWFLVAALLAAVFALLTTGVGLLMPGVHLDPQMTALFDKYKAVLPPDQLAQMKAQMRALPVHPYWLGLLQGIIAGFTVNALVAFGEELGWRGFLRREFAGLGFWRASLVIGLLWGVWHAPLILQGYNYPQHPVLGLLMMTGWTVLLTPPALYVALRARSVWAAAVFHGTINGVAMLASTVLVGGSELVISSLGLAGFVALAIIDLALLVLDRRSADPVTVGALPRQ